MLDPIPTEGLTAEDVPKLAERTRELMLREIIDLTAQVRRQAVPVAAGHSSNGAAATTATASAAKSKS